jgi:hypothetical protein
LCGFKRLQEPYSEDYAEDIKSILGMVRWTFDESFATTTIQKGVTFRPIGSDAQSAACVKLLNTVFNQYALNSKRQPIGGGIRSIDYDIAKAPSAVKQCHSSCVEIDIGNDARE